MSAGRCRRSRRNKPQNQQANNNCDAHQDNQHVQQYHDKFLCIEYPGFSSTICAAYIHQNTQHLFAVIPPDVASICFSYFNDDKLKLNELDEVILQITDIVYRGYDGYINAPRNKDERRILEETHKGTLKVKYCTLKLGRIFNSLSWYEKTLVCRRMVRQKVYPIHELIVYPPDDDIANDEKKSRNLLAEQLFFTEYILCKRYSTLQKLDLSELQLTDRHLLSLCNGIDEIITYNTQRKQKKQLEANENLQSPNKADAGKHCEQQPAPQKKSRRNKKKPASNKASADHEISRVFGKNKAVHQVLLQQIETAQDAAKNQQMQPVKMKLHELNLSNNAIGNQYFALLLRTIKAHMPNLKLLEMSLNEISDYALPWIMKYDIRRLRIDLSGCNVTLKALSKYQRYVNRYDDEMFVYCKDMVYFVNEKEQQEQQHQEKAIKGGNRVRGKGKKYQASRKRTSFLQCDEDDYARLS